MQIFLFACREIAERARYKAMMTADAYKGWLGKNQVPLGIALGRVHVKHFAEAMARIG